MDKQPQYFVSGSFTGTGDVEIIVIETSYRKLAGAVFCDARAKHSPETYYFNQKFLIIK